MLDTKAKPKPISENALPPLSTSTSLNGVDDCVVANGTKIEGNFNSKQNLRLDGVIHGKVNCENRFVMGKSGHIEGRVHTKDAIIMGFIEGDILTENTLHLKNTAIIKGDIIARRLIVDEGARHMGKCQVGVEEKFKN